jgi:hypothetical protein
MTENELYDLMEELDWAKYDCTQAALECDDDKREAAKARWSAITERIRFKLSSQLQLQGGRD